ncbi:hypothetical protein BVRB_2g032080 [Beta vulgaris subsp. vulgaris]|nr:hypothetical protein BVRB_2g032080 [Beta vulgaris subsp. vulgaris]
MIKKGWKELRGGSPMFRVSRQLASTRYDVFKWCREFRTRYGIVWDDFTMQCEEAQLEDTSVLFAEKEERIRNEVKKKLDIQLQYWRQRAKGKWTAMEDTNSKWFYRRAKARKRKNEILMIKNKEGRWITDNKGIQDVMLDFFGNIFRVNEGSIEKDQSNEPFQLNAPLPQISLQQAHELQERVSSHEIRQAVMQMSPLKAPGPDGVPAIFYQKHWNSVGPSVTAAVQYFFDSGYILQGLVYGDTQRSENREQACKNNKNQPSLGKEREIFSYGRQHGQQIIIEVDGAWKQVRKKENFLAGIGWMAKEGSRVLFRGNDMVKANSALQCEGLATLRAINEAIRCGKKDIRILTDSVKLIHALNNKSSPIQLINVCKDIYSLCNSLNSCEIVKVDRVLIEESHKLATSARKGMLI